MGEKCILCCVCFVSWSGTCVTLSTKARRPEGQCVVWHRGHRIERFQSEEPEALIPAHA